MDDSTTGTGTITSAGLLSATSGLTVTGAITTNNNISTTGTGTITSGGLITATSGLTATGAITSNSLYYENTNVVGGVVNAYTLSYTTGGVFYIPTGINVTANSTLVITNIPTTTTQSFTFTVGYYQTSTRFYINSLRVSDTGTTYLLGTSSTFVTPYYNGGTPVLTGTSPCLILQQFTVFSVGTSRYIGTSISCFQ